MTVGESLREARQRAGVPLRDAARSLAVDEVTVWRYETDRARVPDDVLTRAAVLYGAREVLAAHPVVQAYLDWSDAK